MYVCKTISDPDNPGPFGESGPFIAIGLPQPLALVLAGRRSVLSVRPQNIAYAGLHRLEGALIACPLLGNDGDALDILAELAASGYRGPVMVLTPPLPDPAMVERELALAAPGISISLRVI